MFRPCAPLSSSSTHTKSVRHYQAVPHIQNLCAIIKQFHTDKSCAPLSSNSTHIKSVRHYQAVPHRQKLCAIIKQFHTYKICAPLSSSSTQTKSVRLYQAVPHRQKLKFRVSHYTQIACDGRSAAVRSVNWMTQFNANYILNSILGDCKW